MSEINAEVADSDFQRMLLRFADYKNKSLPEIIRAQARLMCVNLAHNTQPYGADSVAKFKGQNAVRRDIRRVFIGPAEVKKIARIGMRNKNYVSRVLMLTMINGDSEGVRAAWQQLTNRSVDVTFAPEKSHHQTQRDKKGHVRRNSRIAIVMGQSALTGYRISREKLVGFAKSGWATAARVLGTTRGIPGWVSRNRGPGSAEDRTGDASWPRVVLSNQVRYIDTVLPPIEVTRALRLQEQKMNRAMQHQMRAELRDAA